MPPVPHFCYPPRPQVLHKSPGHRTLDELKMIALFTREVGGGVGAGQCLHDFRLGEEEGERLLWLPDPREHLGGHLGDQTCSDT